MIDWTSCTVCARIAGSSASGIPALTSSICAPASTCASASATTVSKLPAAISPASALRPVGLMRSPITTNGRSKPMTTSLVGDDSTVSAHPFSLPFLAPTARASRPCTPRRATRASCATSASRSSPQARGSRRHSSRYASLPIRPARIAAESIASWNRGRELARGAGASLLGGHLRRDVPPPDDSQLSQRALPRSA